MSDKQNQYEAMFLLPAGASADVEGSIATVKAVIEKHEGKILVIKKWDERKLAYEIKKQKRGLYVVAFFTAPGKAVATIEREVNLSETMLRVLITKADHMTETEMAAVEPQPIQPKEERNPWDRPEERPSRGPRDDRGPREDRAPRGPRREEATADAKD